MSKEFKVRKHVHILYNVSVKDRPEAKGATRSGLKTTQAYAAGQKASGLPQEKIHIKPAQPIRADQ